MKKEDIEKVKAGHPVQTIDGRDVRIICWNFDCKSFPVIALVKNNSNGESIQLYTSELNYYDNEGSTIDLVLKKTKREGWVNLYRDDDTRGLKIGSIVTYDTKEEALFCKPYNKYGYVDTIKIEWEE